MLGRRVFTWARGTPYLEGLPRDVAVLSFVAFSVALGYGIAAPALPVYARTFGVSAFLAGLVISGFALMRLVSAAPAGILVDRWGERRVMSIGIWIVAASSLLTAAAQTFPQLLVLRGLGGIGSAMFTVSAMALVLRTSAPEQRGRASGAFQAGFLFGGVAGPAIGGAVVGVSIRAPFVVYGITLVVAGSIAARFLSRAPRVRGAGTVAGTAGAVAGAGTAGAGTAGAAGSVDSPGSAAPEPPAPDSPTTTPPQPAPESPSRESAPLRSALPEPSSASESAPRTSAPEPSAPSAPARLADALRSAAYRAALMVNLSNGFIAFGLRISLVPLFVTEGLGRGVGLVGVGFVTAAAIQAIALVPAGRRTDSTGRRGSLVLGAVALVTAMLLLALGTGTIGFLAAMAASGLSAAFLGSASAAVVGDVTRGRPGGRVVSVFQMVGDLGGILGPLLAGAIADALGFHWAFATGAAVACIALAMVAAMPETLRRPVPALPAPDPT